MRALLLAVAILAAGCFIGVPVSFAYSDGTPYNALVVGQQTGSPNAVTWTYSITNTSSDSDYVLWLVGVEVNEGCEAVSITSPSGWMPDDSQKNFISWVSTGRDIAVGEELTGFGITFNSNPEFQHYEAMFNNTSTGAYPTQMGEISVSVPEPGSVIALLTGLAPLTAFAFRRQR